MFFWGVEDPALRLVLCVLIGGVTGAIPLTVGLIRGNWLLAGIGFGVTLAVAFLFFPAAVLPAIGFTVLVAVIDPPKARPRKKRRPPPPVRRRRERADDFLDNDYYDDRPRRRPIRDGEYD